MWWWLLCQPSLVGGSRPSTQSGVLGGGRRYCPCNIRWMIIEGIGEILYQPSEEVNSAFVLPQNLWSWQVIWIQLGKGLLMQFGRYQANLRELIQGIWKYSSMNYFNITPSSTYLWWNWYLLPRPVLLQGSLLGLEIFSLVKLCC